MNIFSFTKTLNTEEFPKVRPEIKKIYDYIKLNIEYFDISYTSKSYKVTPIIKFIELNKIKYISIEDFSLNISDLETIYSLSKTERDMFYNLTVDNVQRRTIGSYLAKYESLKRFTDRL